MLKYDVKVQSGSFTAALNDLSKIDGVVPTHQQGAMNGIFITVEFEGYEEKTVEKIKQITGFMSITKVKN